MIIDNADGSTSRFRGGKPQERDPYWYHNEPNWGGLAPCCCPVHSAAAEKTNPEGEGTR